ncbi:MAG: serine/threonine-protein kinase [Desulfomonilaceae bacterium]|nr:serine/threonine-protein kinase [Desulfomonilaceae bacterium]
MNRASKTKYCSVTIEAGGKPVDLQDASASVLGRAVKRSPEEVRKALETTGIRLAKVLVNRDLELLIKALRKSGLSVKAEPIDDDREAARHPVPGDNTVRNRLVLPSSAKDIEPNWRKGDVIEGTYEVLGSVAGGMGNVYFVYHRFWKMKLAIKTPQRAALKNEMHILRFLREAELWVDLGLHPNIAACYYVRVLHGIPRLFIEYVDGGDLHQWRDQNRLTDLWTVADLMLQFTHGMMYAEEKGMIHRDIKPANCLISRDKLLKITDFGLVKRIDEAVPEMTSENLSAETTRRTDTNATQYEDGIIGSPWYMAPERLSEKGRDDITSDIYSFGVMLYELAVGSKPFRFPNGFSIQGLFRRHLRARPVDPLSIRSDLPPKLVEVMLTCLEKKPENRYPSFADVRVALEAAVRDIRPDLRPRRVPGMVGLKADSLNNQAVSVLDLGREEDALRLLEDAHSANNEHLETVYNLYTLRWARGKISDEEVIHRLESLRIEVRETPDFAHLMGLVSLQRGDPSRAVRLLEKACKEADHYRDRWRRYDDGPRGFVRSLGFMPIGEIGRPAGHMKSVRSIAFSPDAKTAFSVGEDRTIRIWDVDGGRCLKTIRTFAFAPVAGAFSPDGRFAATAYGDAFKTVDLWDLKQGSLFRKYEGMGAVCVKFSDDSRNLVALDSDGRIRIRDLSSHKVVWETTECPTTVSEIGVLNGGEVIVIGGVDGSLHLWRTGTGEPLSLREGHKGRVTFIGGSSDGSIILTGSADETVRLWESPSGKGLHQFRGHRGTVLHASFTADGRYVLSASADGSVKIWDHRSGRCFRTLTMRGEDLTACAVSSTSTKVLCGGARGSLQLWAIDTNWFSQSFLEPAICRPRTFRELSIVHDVFNNLVKNFRTHWDRGDTGTALKDFERICGMPGFSWSREAVLIRNLLQRSSTRGRLKSGSFVRSFHGHSDAVVCVQGGPDSLTLLTGSLDGTAVLWDVVSARKIKQFNVGSPVRKVRFLSRIKSILTWSEDTVLRVWDFEANLLREIPDVCLPIALNSGSTEAAAMSRDGRPLRMDLERLEHAKKGLPIKADEFVGFSDNLDSVYTIKGGTRIQRWSAFNGRNEASLRDLGLRITSVKPSALNQRMVAGMETGEIVIYVLGSGVNVATLRGHTAAVRALDSSPDSRYWITGSDDCSVRLWDLEDERCLVVLEGHASPITGASFFPNGTMLASAGNDGIVRLWGLEWEITAVWKGSASIT